VLDRALVQQLALVFEPADDGGVRVLAKLTGEVRHARVEACLRVERVHQLDARRAADAEVVFAVGRRQVHDARAVLRADERIGQHHEAARLLRKIRQQRFIPDADQRRAGQRFLYRERGPQLGVLGQARRREHVRHAALRIARAHVLDLGPDAQREVARQRPGRGGPGEQLHRTALCWLAEAELFAAARHAEGDGDGGILDDLVVAVGFEVGERSRQLVAVGHDAVRLVDPPLVPELLEHPPHALHVGGVHRLVVVVEVHPAPDARDGLAPLGDIGEHHLAALAVERIDAERQDLARAGQAQRFLRERFDRQPVAVPAKAPLHGMAAHVPVAGHDVLDRADEQMPVVRRARREGRAVVEDERLTSAAAPIRLGKRVELAPELEHALLELGKRGARLDLSKRAGGAVICAIRVI
jgi:hypothetical protein